MRVVYVAHCFFFLFFIKSFAQLPQGFIREKIAGELNPTSIAQAPDGRIFITEKNGVIRVIQDYTMLEFPFLELEVDDTNERGLGHMVLHPEFETNGYYYVHYSVFGTRFNRVSRFTASGDHTIPGSERIIFEFDDAGSDMHNGGSMLFGQDGYLYIGTGDGGQGWLAEEPGSTNGKILRLDDDGNAVPDNPWYHIEQGRANTVFASGFRNPYTMSINLLTGKIYANDVGAFKFEEVNEIKKGGFYGWPVVEGKQSGQNLPPEYCDPIFQYGHYNDYCAIVGSAFYLPLRPQFPQEYFGRYFYSDYCTGHIRMLDVETGADKGIFINDGNRIIDLLVSHDGSFYYLERQGIGDGSPEDNAATDEGILWKVTYTGSGAPNITRQPEDILVSAGEDALFSIDASGAQPLIYKWFINGEETGLDNQPVYRIENASTFMDSLSVSCVVKNSFGEVSSDTVILRVTDNLRPDPIIHHPMQGSLFAAGNSISFSGSAFDPEDGVLPDSSFSWRIDFHHGTHTHPAMSWTSGLSTGTWLIPTLGETASDVWYRIHLKVSDSHGLIKVVHHDIFPQLGSILLNTEPRGLALNLDGTTQNTPFQLEGVRGIRRYITAPQKQVKGDSIYFFERWKDGNLLNKREIFISQNGMEYTGIFKSYPIGQGIGLTGSYYDNVYLEGIPLLQRIDSTISYQFYFKSPDVTIPEDFFSIKWDGYLQAYKTGEYIITVIADDGVVLRIDNTPLINDWNPGVHQLSESIYLEKGHLYPIHLRMFDQQYNSQIKLRWSGADFNEEIIPSSQLYPSDFLSGAIASGYLSIKTISSESLEIWAETYIDLDVDLAITSTSGHTFHSNYHIGAGKSLISVDISVLAPGMYFLTGINRSTGVKEVLKFVKVQ